MLTKNIFSSGINGSGWVNIILLFSSNLTRSNPTRVKIIWPGSNPTRYDKYLFSHNKNKFVQAINIL